MRTLREASGTRVGLPATKWMLAVGAVFMRTETEPILKSRRLFPADCVKVGSSSITRSGLLPLATSATVGKRPTSGCRPLRDRRRRRAEV
jgi:hypothetical protein